MMRTVPRLALLLLLAAAWLFASNHCAFSTLTAHAQAADHACCHDGDPAPVSDAMTGCCQALNAPLPVGATVPLAPLAALLPTWALSDDLLPALQTVSSPEPFTLAPPGVVSFAEQVLHRSLRAHAPPAGVV